MAGESDWTFRNSPARAMFCRQAHSDLNKRGNLLTNKNRQENFKSLADKLVALFVEWLMREFPPPLEVFRVRSLLPEPQPLPMTPPSETRRASYLPEQSRGRQTSAGAASESPHSSHAVQQPVPANNQQQHEKNQAQPRSRPSSSGHPALGGIASTPRYWNTIPSPPTSPRAIMSRMNHHTPIQSRAQDTTRDVLSEIAKLLQQVGELGDLNSRLTRDNTILQLEKRLGSLERRSRVQD
ncbi:uncharacterized protein PgNI_04876 [Pyricularia grisea]|uniref:Uncharacterized protein n=1 Tax=Pyricularia grisea TaxID=148305 RepID=A0A6P8BAA5_PYRGI|nr:uncharacterized protein PgNI_04876 [Pyricularia grisea]TLD12739.1 hypothetical protein PgNI_04876 [Pyricularia grisea]